jgi:hypothetical protein
MKMSVSFLITSIVFLFFDFNLQTVSSQTTTGDNLIKERVEYIQELLDNGKPGAGLWWNGWLAGYSAATVGQGIVFFVSDKKNTKEDMATGAVTTLLGAVGQLLTPMVPVKAASDLATMKEDTYEEKILKLDYAEKLLLESSIRERNGRTWQTHAIAGIVNVSSGLITWLGFKRTVWAGVWNFALNTAVTEAQIWSQPTRAIKDYETYCNKYCREGSKATLKPEMNLYVGVSPGGFNVKIVF